MEFLRSLLRRRFARAQVATSRDVGCFVRLVFCDWEKLSCDSLHIRLECKQQKLDGKWLYVKNVNKILRYYKFAVGSKMFKYY